MLKRLALGLVLILLVAALPACRGCADRTGDDPLLEQARELTQRYILVDTHIDAPYRLQEEPDDVGERNEGGDFDYYRASVYKAGSVISARKLDLLKKWAYLRFYALTPRRAVRVIWNSITKLAGLRKLLLRMKRF